jgi:hypothetical protein
MFRSLLVACVASLTLGSHAVAQDPGPGIAPTTPDSLGKRIEAENPWLISLTTGGTHQFSTDLRGNPGSYQVSRLSSGVGVGYRLNADVRLSLDLGSEISWYDFENATTVLPPPAGVSAKPFHVMYDTSINPGVRYSIDKDWFVFAGGIFQFAGEREADIGDTFTAGGFVGAGYRVDENLTLSAGLLAKTSLEDDVSAFPIIGVNWKITDNLRLDTRGLGATLSLKVSDPFTVFLEAFYESREFRLSDENFLRKGVVRDRQLPVALGVVWRACEGFTLTLRGGVVAYQQFDILNQDGNRQNRFRSDPTGFVGIKGEFKF